MELVVRKNELLRELQLFQGIVERKNTIPILANVLMEAKGDEVRMLATDLEVAKERPPGVTALVCGGPRSAAARPGGRWSVAPRASAAANISEAAGPVEGRRPRGHD